MVSAVLSTAKEIARDWEPFKSDYLRLPAKAEAETVQAWEDSRRALDRLPMIGYALAWYLIRNLYGAPFFKPDVHILAIADYFYGQNPDPIGALSHAVRALAPVCTDSRLTPIHLGKADYILWWYRSNTGEPGPGREKHHQSRTSAAGAGAFARRCALRSSGCAPPPVEMAFARPPPTAAAGRRDPAPAAACPRPATWSVVPTGFAPSSGLAGSPLGSGFTLPPDGFGAGFCCEPGALSGGALAWAARRRLTVHPSARPPAGAICRSSSRACSRLCRASSASSDVEVRFRQTLFIRCDGRPQRVGVAAVRLQQQRIAESVQGPRPPRIAGVDAAAVRLFRLLRQPGAVGVGRQGQTVLRRRQVECHKARVGGAVAGLFVQRRRRRVVAAFVGGVALP